MLNTEYFSRGAWLDVEEFKKHFGPFDTTIYFKNDLNKALCYGAMRVNLESDNLIKEAVGDKFPGELSQSQADTVLEAIGLCTNNVLRQGLEGLRGSFSLSLGQTSLSQTFPDEPDYFQPFIRVMLSQVGLFNKIIGRSIPTKEEELDPMYGYRGKDSALAPASVDYVERTFIAKRGNGKLSSKDDSINIAPNGGSYDGIDLSIDSDFWNDGKDKFTEETFKTITETVGQALKEIQDLLDKGKGGEGKDGEKYKKEIDQKFADFEERWKQYRLTVKGVLDKYFDEMDTKFAALREEGEKWKQGTKNELLAYIDQTFKDMDLWDKVLEELKKPQYKGKDGKDGSRDFEVKDMVLNTFPSSPDRFTYPTKTPINYAGKKITLNPPTVGYAEAQVIIAPLFSGGGNGPDTTIQGLVMGAKSTRYSDLKLVDGDPNNGTVRVQRVGISSSGFKENEDLGDIIKEHRQYKILIDSLEQTQKANKQKLVELDNVVSDMQTSLSNLQKELDTMRAKQGGKIL